MAELTITIAVEELTDEAIKAAENGKNGRCRAARERSIYDVTDEMAKDAARLLKMYCEACGDECVECFLQREHRIGSCVERIPELWEIPE